MVMGFHYRVTFDKNQKFISAEILIIFVKIFEVFLNFMFRDQLKAAKINKLLE